MEKKKTVSGEKICQSLMAMSPGLLLPRSGAIMQYNPLVCRDNGELVKSEEIALLEKRDTKKKVAAALMQGA